jgi:hypothetical protein
MQPSQVRKRPDARISIVSNENEIFLHLNSTAVRITECHRHWAAPATPPIYKQNYMDANNESTKPNQRLSLRYQRELSAIENCPGSATLSDCMSIRAVHEDIQHPDNFAPIALRDPARLKRASSMETRCSLWSLSMFESVEQLCSMVKRVERTTKRFRDLIGHYYVEMKLHPVDGVRTVTSATGHFALHPSVTFDAKVRILAHKLLPP